MVPRTAQAAAARSLSTAGRTGSRAAAVLWILLASLAFAILGVCVKYASAHFNTWELVFYRGVIGMLIMAAIARTRGIALHTRMPGMHAWRSMLGVLSMGAWFYGIGHLPLATAVTLNYMSSVWIAAFLVGGALLGWPRRPHAAPPRRPQIALVLTVLAGFGGVVLVLQPTLERDQTVAGVVGLLSGMTAAVAYLQVAALARAGEPDTRTVFYFALASALAGLLAMALFGASPWTLPSALWLPPVGVLAALGQLCMTRAFRQGATLMVANLQYSGIVFAALFGMLLFGDRIGWPAWLGIAVIIGSGIAATGLRARAQREGGPGIQRAGSAPESDRTSP